MADGKYVNAAKVKIDAKITYAPRIRIRYSDASGCIFAAPIRRDILLVEIWIIFIGHRMNFLQCKCIPFRGDAEQR